MITKHLQSDRLSLLILVFIYLISYVLNIATKNYKAESLALMTIGVVLFPVMFILYKKSIKHKTFNILFVVAHAYLIIVVNLNGMILPENYPATLLPFIGNYYGIMAVIVCSSQKSFRFIQTLALAVFSILVTSIVLGINKQFDLTIVYQIFFYALVLIRKYSHLK